MREKKVHILMATLLVVLSAGYLLIDNYNELSSIKRDSFSKDQEIQKLNDQLRIEQELVGVYRSRLIDLQTFLKSPTSINYLLPYDSNECQNTSGSNTCQYFEYVDYLRDHCELQRINSSKLDSKGNSISTQIEKDAYIQCKLKYKEIFDNWN